MTPNQKLKTLESLAAEAGRRIKKLREENVRLQAEVRDLRERAGKLEGEHRDTRRADEKLARARAKIEKLIGFIEKLERKVGPDREPVAAPIEAPAAATASVRPEAVAPEGSGFDKLSPNGSEAPPAAEAEPETKPRAKAKKKVPVAVLGDQHEFPFGGQ